MGDAAAKRAERRRQKILLNSDERMKRIFGGDSYHDEHLQIVTCPDEPSLDTSPPILNSEVSEIFEQLINSPRLPKPHVEAKKEEVLAATVQISRVEQVAESVPFWCTFGLLMRMLLVTNYSHLVLDNALVSYVILLSALLMFAPSKKKTSVNSYLEILAKFSGLPESKISAMTQSYVLLKKIMLSFVSYFVGFVTVDFLQNCLPF